MAKPLLVFSDERMRRHDPGHGHPERPQRLAAAAEGIARAQRDGHDIRLRQPTPLDPAEAALVHNKRHVDRLLSFRGGHRVLDVDTLVCPDSLDAALLAAGAARDAAMAVIRAESRAAIALVRPPGHHAEPRKAMGFCLFNNTAIAAAIALRETAIDRVLIVDWDIHHGNGTQRAFYDRRDALFFSTHRYPFYPGTGGWDEQGSGQATGYTVNVPLPASLTDDDLLAVYQRVLLPIADQYEPDLILVSAGFDAHRADPLGDMNLSTDCFAALSALVRAVAERHAQGRIVLVLEGGYDLEALADCVHACAAALSDAAAPEPEQARPTDAGEFVIERAQRIHGRYWPAINPRAD